MTATTATVDSQTNWQQDFAGQTLSAQAIETARGQWKEHLSHTWGGMGDWVHTGASWLQTAAGAVMIGSAPTLAIPVVGEIVEGAEGLVYGAATAFKGAVKTSAENHAITAAGGTKDDHGGVGRTVGNIVKAAVPIVDI